MKRGHRPIAEVMPVGRTTRHEVAFDAHDLCRTERADPVICGGR
jgi:hypothetical protein